MVEYLEFMELIQTPPLMVIADFALMATNRLLHLTDQDCVEWLDQHLSELTYQQCEFEDMDFNHSGFSHDLGQAVLPINTFLESVNASPAVLEKHRSFIKRLGFEFNYLYTNLPFPEQFHDLEPFYEYSINLINSNAAMLEITEKEDVEYITDQLTK